ncbi:hypothetical protein EV421DRAFT_1731214 [Armillaria borealis]|uniref:Uncharacterized protein n=1 Tax=Armillaria borealis TaxID=47425 RepID=A0AA39MZF8_9AGAR|nr:hypothetical protein EV421DRAFT_1731214 [Armillaria borealis]
MNALPLSLYVNRLYGTIKLSTFYTFGWGIPAVFDSNAVPPPGTSGVCYVQSRRQISEALNATSPLHYQLRRLHTLVNYSPVLSVHADSDSGWGSTLSHNMYSHPLLRLFIMAAKLWLKLESALVAFLLQAISTPHLIEQFGDYPMEYESSRRLIMGLLSYQSGDLHVARLRTLMLSYNEALSVVLLSSSCTIQVSSPSVSPSFVRDESVGVVSLQVENPLYRRVSPVHTEESWALYLFVISAILGIQLGHRDILIDVSSCSRRELDVGVGFFERFSCSC